MERRSEIHAFPLLSIITKDIIFFEVRTVDKLFLLFFQGGTITEAPSRAVRTRRGEEVQSLEVPSSPHVANCLRNGRKEFTTMLRYEASEETLTGERGRSVSTF